jgi:hypothetical protein
MCVDPNATGFERGSRQRPEPEPGKRSTLPYITQISGHRDTLALDSVGASHRPAAQHACG